MEMLVERGRKIWMTLDLLPWADLMLKRKGWLRFFFFFMNRRFHLEYDSAYWEVESGEYYIPNSKMSDKLNNIILEMKNRYGCEPKGPEVNDKRE